MLGGVLISGPAVLYLIVAHRKDDLVTRLFHSLVVAIDKHPDVRQIVRRNNNQGPCRSALGNELERKKHFFVANVDGIVKGHKSGFSDLNLVCALRYVSNQTSAGSDLLRLPIDHDG